jgi:hypothetical protein
VQILTDKPKEIFYAAADAERISDYILTIEQKKEIQHTQEVGVMRDNLPHAERSYLVVPYAERQEAKALEARWDAVKKASYDLGNLLSVATSVHELWPEKRIVIAGDDDHRIENNPGRELTPIV